MIRRRIVAPLAVAAAIAGGGVAGALIGIPGLSGAQETSTTTPTSGSGSSAAPLDHHRGGPGLDAAAKALNLSTQELLSKLSDGKTTIADVAQAQGIDLNKVIDAMVGEARDRITQMVHQPLPHGGLDRHGLGRHGGPGLDAAAQALNMSTPDLLTQLRSGKTIAQVASDKGVDVQKVIDAMVADVQSKLDQAVKDGRLTQQEADQHKAQLKDRITQMVNDGLPKPPAWRTSTPDGSAPPA